MISQFSSVAFASPLTLAPRPTFTPSRAQFSAPTCSAAEPSTYAVVVIGSGLGGLTAAALLSTYGKSVCVLEAHTIPGGAAHAFTRPVPGLPNSRLTFDSGPHLHSGLRPNRPSSNPLRHALTAVNADVDILTYPSWGCFFPEGYFSAPVTSSTPLFSDLVSAASSPAAAAQVASLIDAMRPLCAGATAVPPAALRGGDVVGSLRVGLRAAQKRAAMRGMRLGDAAKAAVASPALMKPFKPLLDQFVTDPFANKFIDLLCFLLAGVTSSKIPIAEIAFMFDEWTGGGGEGESAGEEVLEHPVGGSAALVGALVDAVNRGEGSVVRTGARVTDVLFEDNDRAGSGKQAVGVALASGERVLASEAVVSNLSSWDMWKMLSKTDGAGVGTPEKKAGLPKADGAKASQGGDALTALPSFLHLHLAFKADEQFMASLPHALETNYVSVSSWEKEIDAPENVVLISMPSVIDETCAPDGYHVLHAYTPATEPFDIWEAIDSAAEYEALKLERCKCLWDAVEKIIPNAREQAIVTMEGTPVTHERFLNIHRGTYGPETDAAAGADAMLPGQKREDIAEKFWTVGQSTFPGIGVPAVAASGWIAANGLTDVTTQQRLLESIDLV